LTILSYKGKSPTFPKSCFIAKNATLVGDVTLGEESSVWFNAVLRAETSPIAVGRRTNIQDNCVVHTDAGYPVSLGDGVTIGHGAIIHGARVSSNSLVGMGATLLNGAVIGENCIVAAGSLVTQGKKFEDGVLVVGSPATAKRKLSREELESIRENARHYVDFRADYLSCGYGYASETL
jgi:carbonic anhydrase/acetyltransferase-like protein (isoleucine patch superfamily)